MGLRSGLDSCGKSRPPPGFDPRTVQPVASRYTDYATRSSYIRDRSMLSLLPVYARLLETHKRKCFGLSTCYVLQHIELCSVGTSYIVRV